MNRVGHDTLDPVAPHGATPKCAQCGFLEPASAPPGSLCALRQCHLSAPESSCCPSHTQLTRKPDKVPLGPVISIRENEIDVVHGPIDSRKARDQLVKVLESIRAVRAEDLSFRERMAIWQARDLDDRRFYVHLDTIESRLVARASPGKRIEASLPKAIAGDAVRADPQHGSYPENFTLAGRLLIFSAIVFACLTFWALVALQAQMRMEMMLVSAVPAVVAGALYLRLGLIVFRRFNIHFRAS